MLKLVRNLRRRMRPGSARVLLSVAGLALISAAAWTLHSAAGLAVAGVSCLLIEWQMS